MAYRIKVATECANYGCKAATKYEVFNNKNSSHGKYCGKHSVELVHGLSADENKTHAGAVKKRKERD